MTLTEDLDALAARALTAAESERRGGWLLRATPAPAPRRISSALPIGDPPLDVGLVTAWYAERGLEPIVMVSPNDADGPRAELDAELDAAGWTLEAPTVVLTASPEDVLAELDGPPHAVVPGELGAPDSLDPVVPLVTAAGAGRATVVLHERWSLLRGLQVADDARRQGIGSALVRAWARVADGRGLYLQVEADNAPALALYERAGFTRSHGYHYRRAPGGTR